jgi:hypothetical protein
VVKSLFCCFLPFASLYCLSRCDFTDSFYLRVLSTSIMWALFGSCLVCTCTFFCILWICFCNPLLVLPFWACCPCPMSFVKSSVCFLSHLSRGGLCDSFFMWFSFFCLSWPPTTSPWQLLPRKWCYAIQGNWWRCVSNVLEVSPGLQWLWW